MTDELANEITPPVAITISGKDYQLSFASMRSVLAFKQKTGRNLFTAEGWKGLRPAEDPESCVAFFWASLQQFHKEVSYEQATDMLSFKNLAQVFAKCEEAAIAALPKREETAVPNAEGQPATP